MRLVTGPTTSTPLDPPDREPAPGQEPRPEAEPPEAVPPEPGERPPAAAIRLEVPPSQRYVMAARGSADDAEGDEPSLARGALIGGVVALFLAAVLVVLGSMFTFTAGLIVVAVFLGRLTAVGVNAGASDAGSAATRRALAVGISLAGIAVAQVGLWLWAGFEGGTLGLVGFLADVYQALVPLQFLLAAGTAWLSAR